MPSLLHTDYTVAWICALPSELTAAICMLDEQHSALSRKPQDNNTYTLGCIAGHNVVIVCLPAGQTGTNSAAAVASQLRYSFPNVRFGLMVGIGGGAPSKHHDVRLGDVVVSIPGKLSTGVIQYDFGRTVAEGRFVRDTILNAPPQILLSAVNTVIAKHKIQHRKMDSILSEGQCTSLGPEYVYPGDAHDMLFRADYDHEEEYETCINCDKSMLEARTTRDSKKPVIHHGTIASANQVMRHGRTRENCRKELDVLCFEMEAAGLMNNLPCLVVRGICDYSDSHKNKEWQGYAAMTAAAYSKELLHTVVADRPVQKQDRLAGIGAQSREKPQIVTAMVLGHEASFTEARSPQSLDETDFLIVSKRSDWAMVTHDGLPFNVFDSLSDYDQEATLRSFARRRCPETTQWILNDDRFKAWSKRRSHACLWLSGKIGSGKTIAATIVVQYLLHEPCGSDLPVFHFFYNQSYKSRVRAIDLFESYAKQMISYFEIRKMNYTPQVKSRIKKYYGPRGQRPSLDDLLDYVIFPLSGSLSSAIFILDGLDECETSDLHSVFKALRRLIQSGMHRVFISGREVLDVRNSIDGSVELPISSSDTVDDIRRFIDWKIAEKMRERPLTQDNDLLNEVKHRLNDKADRMILWVNLQVEMLWDECYNAVDIRTAIENLPKDLDETYHRCLSRIGRRQSPVAQKVLSWLMAAVKPFKTQQLLEALAIDPRTGNLERDKIPQIQDVLRFCANLVIRDEGDQILLAHHSTRKFLEKCVDDSTFTLAPLNGLGTLCVMHLTSSAYTRAVAAPRKPEPALDLSQVPSAILKNWSHGFWTRGLTTSKTQKSSRMSLPIQREQPRNMKELPVFFYFAREQWAPLTRHIDVDDLAWVKFAALALEPDLTYGMHPWRSIGISLDSHFSALLGWSINNDHSPLLVALINSTDPKPRADIFNLPLTSYDNHLPLHLAVKHGNRRIFDYLIPFCDCDKFDGSSRTSLHYACEGGHVQICKRLLTPLKHSKVTTQDKQGQTCLHLAAANGHAGVIVPLFDARMSGKIINSFIEVKDHNGRTPMSLAAMNGHSADLSVFFRYLPALRVMDEGDKDGRTPLMLAAASHHVECIEFLSSERANVEIRDKKGYTALALALSHLHTLPPSSILGTPEDAGWERIVSSMLQHHHFPSTYERAVRSLILLGGKKPWKDIDGNTLLHYAARYGHQPVLAMLMTNNGPNQTSNHQGWTPLHEAAAGGHVACVDMLFHSIFTDKFSTRWGSEETPLHLAVRNGHIEVVETLLRLNSYLLDDADYIKWTAGFLHARGLRGETPLISAVKLGRAPIVAVLLRHPDCGVNARDHLHMTALHWAAEYGTVSIVEDLLQVAAIDVNISGPQGKTPLMFAAKTNHFSAATALLKHARCDVNVKDETKMCALHYAIVHGSDAITEALLQVGSVDANASGPNGATPLILAAKAGNLSAAIALLDHASCEVDARDIFGNNALHRATEHGYVAIVEAFLRSGRFDINVPESRQKTPLHIAVQGYQVPTVRVLLSFPDCNVNAKDADGETPLHHAIMLRHADVAEALLQTVDLDINARMEGGKTALHLAVESGEVLIISLLHGHVACNVNIRDDHGDTPFHTAARFRSLNSISALSACGDLDVDAKNDEGLTALQIASHSGNDLFVAEISRCIRLSARVAEECGSGRR